MFTMILISGAMVVIGVFWARNILDEMKGL